MYNQDEMCDSCQNRQGRCRCEDNQACGMEQHVHEVVGSTVVAERCEECHNHRFATVSDVAIPRMGSHVHNVKFRTDSYEGHFHEFCGTTGPAVWVGGGKHVHFLDDTTKSADQHTHDFRVAVLIDDPIED